MLFWHAKTVGPAENRFGTMKPIKHTCPVMIRWQAIIAAEMSVRRIVSSANMGKKWTAANQHVE
jgi:hypothetical protein